MPRQRPKTTLKVKRERSDFIKHIIQSVVPRPLKALYTSPPDRPVHSGTNSTSLGSILALQQLRVKTTMEKDLDRMKTTLTEASEHDCGTWKRISDCLTCRMTGEPKV